MAFAALLGHDSLRGSEITWGQGNLSLLDIGEIEICRIIVARSEIGEDSVAVDTPEGRSA